MTRRWLDALQQARTVDPGAGDTGFTLIEMLVATMILAMVLTITSLAMIHGLSTQRDAGDSAANVDYLTTSVDRMSKDLAQAVEPSAGSSSPFTAVSTTGVSFFSNVFTVSSGAAITQGPLYVRFFLGTSTTQCPAPDYCLLETDQTTTYSTTAYSNQGGWVATGAAVTRVLAHGVTNGASQPLFTWYVTNTTTDAANRGNPFRTVAVFTPAADGTIATGNWPNVDTVDIDITTQNSARASDSQSTVQDRVSMPNANTAAGLVGK